MPELSRKAIEKLLVHVRLGCLSFIPVSGGTSRNERLHKVLNKTLRMQKIGVQAVVALLGKFLYEWNERKENHMTNYVMPVESCFLSNHSLFQTTERFGVKDISFEKEEYASYQTGSDSSVLSIFKEEESDCDSDNDGLEATVTDIYTDTEEDEIPKWDTDTEHIKNLVKQASNKAKMIDYIKACGKTELFEPILFTSLTAALCLLNSSSARETSN